MRERGRESERERDVTPDINRDLQYHLTINNKSNLSQNREMRNRERLGGDGVLVQGSGQQKNSDAATQKQMVRDEILIIPQLRNVTGEGDASALS